MDNENAIQLSGPFSVTDSLGREWDIDGIRIFDEGYGIIDVYVDFASSMDDEPLYEDTQVIRQILARLRSIGYAGPDFGPGDPGLQDEHLIVLEAPEAFCDFAKSRGWRNLAEEYADEEGTEASSETIMTDAHAGQVYSALMRKLGVR